MKLSVCLAVRNEEKTLHYALDSVKDFADEIVIVDGESSDKTVALAESYGKKVRVIKAKHEQMFHKNKQKAIEAAKGEWILQLDADEAVDDKLREEILSVIPDPDRGSRLDSRLRGNDRVVAYRIPRKNYFLGRFLMKGGVYPDYTTRLYKRGKAHFPCKSVHENVEVQGEVGTLENALLHYADPDLGRYLQRWDRYTTLDAELLKKEGKKPNPWEYLLAKPAFWFLSTFVLHKGFMDGWQGFLFSFLSSIRFWAIYLKAR